MSATKSTRKWSKTATMPQLQQECERLQKSHAQESNPMVRSSLLVRIMMIRDEIAVREKTALR